MWKTLLPLALGGALGAVARWALGLWVDARFTPGLAFPWGILVVNVLGCFLFGWLFARFETRDFGSDWLRMAVFTGFLGSFTTFSTFGWNSFDLLRSGQAALALGNVAASVLLGLGAVWAGFAAGR